MGASILRRRVVGALVAGALVLGSGVVVALDSPDAAAAGPGADLQLVQTVTPDTQSATFFGNTWTLKVTNLGPDASTGHTVQLAFPAGPSNLATSSPGCSLLGNALTCVGGPLAVNATATYTVKGNTAETGASITTTATVSGIEPDPVVDNNSASATVHAVYGVCAARAVGLPGLAIGHANPAEHPCASQSTPVLDETVPLGPALLSLVNGSVRIEGAAASTANIAGAYASDTSVGRVTIDLGLLLGIRIVASGVSSSARVDAFRCVPTGAPSGASSLGTVSIQYGVFAAPTVIPVGDTPLTIPLGVGTLSLNETVQVGNAVVRRAFDLDLPGTSLDVVLGETKAGAACLP